MNQIMIQIQDTEKATLLMRLLETMDFVSSINLYKEKPGELAVSVPIDIDDSAWHEMSEPALLRVWDNDADAVYDDWRALYGVEEG